MTSLHATDTFDTVTELLHHSFEVAPERLQPDTVLRELLDSLNMMEFVFALEDAFRMRIPEDRLDPAAGTLTVQALCDIIDAERARGTA